MKISHNIPALQASMNLKRTGRKLSKSMQKLSSGLKINSARDDAAGLAIANKLDIQAKAMERASTNALDGVSMMQAAEGALNEVHNMLQRMRELAVQDSNDTMEPDDREKIQAEVDQLIEEIDETANKTEFNKIKILNGEVGNRYQKNPDGSLARDIYGEFISEKKPFYLHVGPNYGMSLEISIPSVNHISLGLYDVIESALTTPDIVTGYKQIVPLDYQTRDGAQRALDVVDNVIASVSTIRSDLGAWQNRLEMSIKNLDASAQNIEAARSRIQDTDMAKEMTAYTQRSVMEQAGISILAQANQRPQQILSLVR